MSTVDYTTSNAYLGVWTNWSKGKVYGATLTLPRREAGLLTAFLAIYVSSAGGQFWRIICFIFHQSRAGKKARRGDVLHRQIQVLLRNSEGAGGGLWEFARLPFQWRQWATGTLLPCALFAFLAFLNLSGFGAASIFSSAVAKAAGNETLMYSKDCGVANFPSTLDPTFGKLLRVMHLAQSAAGYARACYGDVDNLQQCTTYPQRQIEWKTLRDVPCPFESNRCLNNQAVAFDTGELDTFKVFGINTAPQDRVTYRRVTTCAPLVLDDLRNITEEVESIHAGPVKSGYSPLDPEAPTFQRSRRAPIGQGYSLETMFATAGGTWSPWVPIQSLNRTDADVTIFFISFNNIEFVGANDDPVFSAHINSTSTLGIPVKKPDQNVSALACAEQNQFCNPSLALDNPARCTKLTASELLWENNQMQDIRLLEENEIKRLHNTSLLLNPFQEVIAGYASSAVSVGMYFSVFSRGVSALKAAETVYQNVQSPIPNDQWIIELSSWFAATLAGFQQSSLEYAMGPQYLGSSGVIRRPAANDTLAQRLCRSQIIRNSSQVQSFSMLGIVLILFLGGLILILSVTMESAVGALQRRFGVGEARHLEWIMDEKLHLMAVQQEEEGGEMRSKGPIGGEEIGGVRGGGGRSGSGSKWDDGMGPFLSRNSIDTARATTTTMATTATAERDRKDTSQVALLDLDFGIDRNGNGV